MKLLQLLKRWGREQKGVAYIEFALCLPVLLLLFGGAIDVTRMIILHQKVEKAVFTVGDLVSRLQTENSVCNNIRNLETTVVRDMVRPFSWEAGQFEFIMTSVIGARQNNNAQNPVEDLMEWRYNQVAQSLLGPFGAPYQSVARLPASITGLATDERVIVTEMTYVFRPLLPNISGLAGGNFRKISYVPVRYVGNIGQGQGAVGNLGC